MSWKTEFPDITIEAPIIEAAGKNKILDTSWHNDVCPSFSIPLFGDEELRLWVDYEKPEDREMQGMRYSISIDFVGDGNIYQTDDANEALAAAYGISACLRALVRDNPAVVHARKLHNIVAGIFRPLCDDPDWESHLSGGRLPINVADCNIRAAVQVLKTPATVAVAASPVPVAFEQIAAVLSARYGYRCTVEWPGVIDVALEDGREITFGTVNETWGGDYVARDGEALATIATPLLSECLKPHIVATVIHDAIQNCLPYTVEPKVLAKAFSKILRSWVSVHIDTIISRNASEADPKICHSHDFCDANMAMARAWHESMGREIDLQNDADRDLWTAAWDEAKRSKFAC